MISCSSSLRLQRRWRRGKSNKTAAAKGQSRPWNWNGTSTENASAPSVLFCTDSPAAKSVVESVFTFLPLFFLFFFLCMTVCHAKKWQLKVKARWSSTRLTTTMWTIATAVCTTTFYCHRYLLAHFWKIYEYENSCCCCKTTILSLPIAAADCRRSISRLAAGLDELHRHRRWMNW